ncbi:cupin domain-containing protein [Halobacteriovorax sp. GB3]|uniref:(R)-mandelonitrile lyase n=1 Tax=Halobacteriovorax sp. GB3 TaxID=2719615 RepID=UPI00235F1399|nr:cupin domain-containing protein [Halobacteriovorax sp. GB3]MDD0852144.1 cupin domain-containing protein [Halobacteriovorax sp. GB3]
MKVNILITTIIAMQLVGCSSFAGKKESRKMVITKQSKVAHFNSTSPVFTGSVAVKMLFTEQGTSKLTGADVTFSKKARSAWHTHPKGQLLVVTKGSGLVQQWGENARKLKAGDVVWTPAGVKHWHGAGVKHELTHTALQEKDNNGKNVNWLEKVSDEQYEKAVSEVK